MSNFATFSEFYERLCAFRSQIDENQFLKLAAFDAAIEGIKDLRDFFAKDPSDCYPPYSLLTATRNKLNVPFDIPDLDEEIKKRVLPELDRLIQVQQATFKVAVRQKVERLYALGLPTDEQENQLIAFLGDKSAIGFYSVLIYPLLLSIKREYFETGRLFAAQAPSFAKVVKQFAPSRFQFGHYDFTPTDAQYYQYYRNLLHTQNPPYSARDARREIEVAEEREEALQAMSISSSAPIPRFKKP